jgi:heme A synthase
MTWWPHVVNAGAVAVILTWTAIRALSQYSEIEAIRRPAILLLSLMVAQLCLGFAAFITRVMWGRDAVQPETSMIVSTVAHTVTGALLLATAVVLAIQVWRHVPVAISEVLPGRPQRAVAA